MSQHHLNVVILAAGKGKRMYSGLPKVLHPLAGKPLLQHVLATARALQPAHIVVVYGHGGEQVPQTLGAEDVIFAKQDPQLGTAHAVAQAVPHLPEKGVTLVLYGDVPLIQIDTLRALVAHGEQRLAILTAELADASGYGRIVRNAKGHITGIVEDKDANVKQRAIKEVNSGILALPSAQLADWLKKIENNNAQGEYYLTDVVALALKDKMKIESEAPHHGIWEIQGINNKQQLAQAERIYQWQQAKHFLQAGVTLIDPMRFDVRGKLHCGQDVSIDIDCIFEGNVTLEAGVSIGAHCIIKNTTIGAGTRIAPFTHIDGAIIGTNCIIGPYARIRPGSTLAADVHIGNFVELKNSQLGDGTKANHLSYLGDATIGKHVNVGAGAITCNYDGANKHRTVIEDDVSIGADTQLVAPVTIHKGATIGAGSVITANAPAGKLTLTRARQTTIEGWERPQKKGKE